MRKIKEKYATELLIYRIFLKHVKLNGMYPIFRCSVNYNNNSRDIFHLLCKANQQYYDRMGRLTNSHSSYIGARSYEDILSIMRESLGGHLTNTNDGKNQMAIMNAVNGLIHSCLEYGIIDGNYQILGQIGEAIFNEVCKAIFGDDFVDKTAEMISPEQAKMLEKMGGMMPPPMDMRGRNRSQVEREFMQWLETHRDMIMHEGTMPPQVVEPRRNAADDADWYDMYERDDDWLY